MRIEKTAVTKELMRIDTRMQMIDMQQIDNRRFMYNPKIGILVLGYQYATTSTLISSHANELADAGITKGYDDFVRGWIGTGGDYPKGVIHFAPCVDERNIKLFNQAFDTLEMFKENGALRARWSVASGNAGSSRYPIFYGYAGTGAEILCPQAAKETAGGKSRPAETQLSTGTIGGGLFEYQYDHNR